MSEAKDTPSSISKISLGVFLALLALFMVGWGSSMMTQYQSDKLVKTAQQQSAASNKELQDFESSAAKERAAVEAASLIGIKSDWERFRENVTSCSEVVQQAQTANDQRVKLQSTLLDSPVGSAVATSEANVKVFSAIKQKYESSTDRIRDWQLSLASHKASTQQMLSVERPVTRVPPDSAGEVLRLKEQSRELLAELQTANRQLEQYVAQGKDIASSDQTLREIIAKREADQLAEIMMLRQKDKEDVLAREEEATRELLRTQEAEKLALQRESLKKVHAAELEAIQAETEASVQAAKARREKTLLDIQLKEEEDAMKLELELINSLLTPFVSKAKNQFKSTGHMIVTAEDTPISFSAIEAFGGLDLTKDGLTKLQQAAGWATQNELRPLGGFSMDYYNQAKTQEAQALLKKHGKAMVRANLLAP